MKKLLKFSAVETFLIFISSSIMFAQPDPDYSKQWYLNKINIQSAWNHTTGDTSLIIAVLDSGIPMDLTWNLSHPELQSNKIIRGKNFTSNVDSLKDGLGHGTHVAGIIRSETNNGIGIAGICFDSKLFISKALTKNNWGDPIWTKNAVLDAIQNGAKIINLSLGFDNDNNSGDLESLVNIALANNVLIVAAAGNEKSFIRYPAKYAGTHSNVIAVSATDENDVFAYDFPNGGGSNYGPEVTVCAPGVRIYSTAPNYSYDNFYENDKNYAVRSGTSMATPIVAGVAGLVWSKYPGYTATQVRRLIELTADDKGTYGRDDLYGYGRVNAYNALRTLCVPEFYPNIQVALSAVDPDGVIKVTSGTYTILSHMTIPVGITLQLQSGVTVTFAGGLTINGSLRTNGATLMFGVGTALTLHGHTDLKNSTFTVVPGGNYWSGINIWIGLSDIKEFVDCNISNALYGITVNSSAKAHLSGTKIYNIKRYTGSPNTGRALNYTSYSLGNIYPNNVFDSNWEHIWADVTATPNAGSSIGQNSFRNPLSCNITNNNPTPLYARDNYWGSVPPNALTFKGNVDYINWHSIDPNPYRSVVSTEDDYKAELESGLLYKIAVENDRHIIKELPGIEELNQAMLLFFNGDYDKVLPEMYRLANTYDDSYVGKKALVFIEHILAETYRAKEILPILEEYSKRKSKVAQFAEYRKGYQYLRLKEYDKAIAIMKATEFSKEDADLRQARLYDLGVSYHDLLGKKAEAYNYFYELVNTYPDCPLADVARTFYPITKDGYEKPTTPKEETTVTETKLFANYPNPFNPSTVIKYQLSEASQVSLKVYDVMGKEVTTLVNSFQNKGSYDVNFNANGFSSGIYFYKLNVNGKQHINKMLLMK